MKGETSQKKYILYCCVYPTVHAFRKQSYGGGTWAACIRSGVDNPPSSLCSRSGEQAGPSTTAVETVGRSSTYPGSVRLDSRCALQPSSALTRLPTGATELRLRGLRQDRLGSAPVPRAGPTLLSRECRTPPQLRHSVRTRYRGYEQAKGCTIAVLRLRVRYDQEGGSEAEVR